MACAEYRWWKERSIDRTQPSERSERQAYVLSWPKPNIAVTRGNLSARLLVVSEQELSSNRLRAESRRIDGQPGI